jgi:hypothetical protein
MSTNLRPFATIAVIAASCFWACEPDLGALSSNYDPNASGAGGTKPESGGAAGVSGTNPSGGTGGANVTGGTGGDESLGGSAGEAGAAGAPPAEGGSGGTATTGGSGGTSGSGGSSTGSSCSNNKRDSNESDVDCGGTSKCGPCDSGLRCTTNNDCVSDFCTKGNCADPTCKDGAKNGSETGTDCGGECTGCDDDVPCNSNDDCKGQYCKDNVCTDHCTSMVKEADETDKDCGGADCGPCDTGKRCVTEKDCISLVCNNQKCAAATCSDGVKNQGEGDIDCGAVCSGEGKWCTYSDAEKCTLMADCDSSVCSNGKCIKDPVPPSPAIDVIDDFEANIAGMLLPMTGGRQGNWYGYDDMTAGSTHTTRNELIPGARGMLSSRAIHTFGSGLATWGGGVGADLNHGSGPKGTYDASFLEDDGVTMTPYVGITFWARSDTAPQAITVALPDGDTDAAGGICNQTGGACDHHWLGSVSVGADWQRFTVLFSELQLEPGTLPQPGPFDPTRLVSVQFRVPQDGAAFDYWIDDVAFVRPQ